MGRVERVERVELNTCAHCGAEFTPKNKKQMFCSDRCRHNAEVARYKRSDCAALSVAMADSQSVSNEMIMRARRKPANTSEVRWRMELRRRANPERYSYFGAVR